MTKVKLVTQLECNVLFRKGGGKEKSQNAVLNTHSKWDQEECLEYEIFFCLNVCWFKPPHTHIVLV